MIFKIVDLEYYWNLNHSNFENLKLMLQTRAGLPMSYSSYSPKPDPTRPEQCPYAPH